MMSSIARAVVTGGKGLIGRSLCLELVYRGFHVVCIDKRRFTKNSLPALPNVEYILGDLRDFNLVKRVIHKDDLVLHLAAGVSFFMYEERPVEEFMNVIHGFTNVLEACRKVGTMKIVFASTSAVYEGNSVPYRENMTLQPPDQKALAKKIIEELAVLYQNRYGLQTVAVRPFSVFGEADIHKGGYANVISLFTWCMLAGKRPVVWRDGSQRRDFIHADDVAKFIVTCALRDTGLRVVNAGTSIETSFNEIINLINLELGTSLEPKYVDRGVDIYATRLKADLTLQKKHGLLPVISVEEGIHRLVSATRDLNPDLLVKLSHAQTDLMRLWNEE